MRPIFFEFPDIHLVIVDTKHKFLSHVPPEISYLNALRHDDLEFQGQGHDIDIHFVEFCDIDLIPIDTKHKYSTIYTTRDIILNALRHDDLEFQGQSSRSRY